MKSNKALKIAIDISPAVYDTGVSVYTKNLVKSLLAFDSVNKYLLFGSSLRRYSRLVDFVSNINSKFILSLNRIPPYASNILWNKIHLSIDPLIGPVDVFHSCDWTEPRSKAFKVTTIHDLSPLVFPELTPPNVVDAHLRRLDWVKKEADRIIVPTNEVLSQLVKNGFTKEKIRVIHEAVNPDIKKSSPEQVLDTKKKFSIEGEYILAVGIGNKRKNTHSLIESFLSIGKKLKSKLVLVGEVREKVYENKNILYLGKISTSELAALYTGASCFVYPSIYEGFGLPILESFLCGCPVVTSNISSMPEVAGDAAVLIDPYSASSIGKGILSAFNNKSLVKKGYRRVKDFSWEKTAKQTLSVYNEVNL